MLGLYSVQQAKGAAAPKTEEPAKDEETEMKEEEPPKEEVKEEKPKEDSLTQSFRPYHLKSPDEPCMQETQVKQDAEPEVTAGDAPQETAQEERIYREHGVTPSIPC